MELKEEGYSLTLVSNTIKIVGKIEKNEYAGISDFLAKADADVSGDSLTIDLFDLKFLNSSGIRTLAVFFLGTKKKVSIKMNEELTWQRVGIKPLANIKPNGMIAIA